MRNERCETCRFWESDGVDSWDGSASCRRFPKYEKRERRHWCGEWKVKPESLDDKVKRVLPGYAPPKDPTP